MTHTLQHRELADNSSNYLEKDLILRRIEGKNAISFTISNPIEIGTIKRKLLAKSILVTPFLKGK